MRSGRLFSALTGANRLRSPLAATTSTLPPAFSTHRTSSKTLLLCCVATLHTLLVSAAAADGTGSAAHSASAMSAGTGDEPVFAAATGGSEGGGNATTTNTTAANDVNLVDVEYPGTAVARLRSVHARVATLNEAELSQPWPEVRRRLLWAGGLYDYDDLTRNSPGRGYTGHAFNDFNHCDLTTMLGHQADAENKGRVEGIAYRNPLGEGIRIASIPELGEGGSWSTCMMGCNSEPPRDVAHIQFRSRIAFKLVWAPPSFTTFVLVDDAGNLLAQGTPSGPLPDARQRAGNYRLVAGGKYATAAEQAGGAPAPSA